MIILLGKGIKKNLIVHTEGEKDKIQAISGWKATKILTYFETQSTFHSLSPRMDTPLEPQVKPAEVRQATAIKKDNTIVIGYVFLATSFFLFALFEWIDPLQGADHFTIFIGHYLLALAYTGILIYHKGHGVQKSWKKQNISKT